VIASIETDKAVVDYEATDDGILAKILQPAGIEIVCGTDICVVVEEGDVSAFANFKGSDAVPAAAADAPATPAPPTPPPSAPTPIPTSSSAERVFASPLARKLSKELGHTLSTINGSGPNARITADDVRAHVPSAAAATTTATIAPPSAVAPSTPVATPGSLDLMSRSVASKRAVPHYYLSIDVDVTDTLALRSRLNGSLGGDADTLSLYDFIVKASALAMRDTPELNSSWMVDGKAAVVRQ